MLNMGAWLPYHAPKETCFSDPESPEPAQRLLQAEDVFINEGNPSVKQSSLGSRPEKKGPAPEKPELPAPPGCSKCIAWACSSSWRVCSFWVGVESRLWEVGSSGGLLERVQEICCSRVLIENIQFSWLCLIGAFPCSFLLFGQSCFVDGRLNESSFATPSS